MRKLTTDRAMLVETGIPFREIIFFSSFWGTRLVITSRKDAMKAEQILNCLMSRFITEWAVEYF